MIRAQFLALALAGLLLGGCSLCPDGYAVVSNEGTYGFAKCEKEKD